MIAKKRNRDLRKQERLKLSKTKRKNKKTNTRSSIRSKNTGIIEVKSKLFKNYTCYQFFHEKEKRWYVKYVNKETGSSRTITRAKFNMECFLNRHLSYDEEVDHIDENKLNDSIDNLQILSKSENIKKHFKIKKEKQQKMK